MDNRGALSPQGCQPIDLVIVFAFDLRAIVKAEGSGGVSQTGANNSALPFVASIWLCDLFFEVRLVSQLVQGKRCTRPRLTERLAVGEGFSGSGHGGRHGDAADGLVELGLV
jgi:hypothetical protein